VQRAEDVLKGFSDRFDAAYLNGMRQKLGLATVEDDDLKLADEILSLLAADKADFTLAFRWLSDAAGEGASEHPLRSLLHDQQAFEPWVARWRQRLAREPEGPVSRRTKMRAINPAFIPRNHRIEEVIAAAVVAADFTPFETLLSVLARPFEDQPAFAHYMDPPQAHDGPNSRAA
jgi:serine/tyrosine/threonine adenylyltransferase